MHYQAVLFDLDGTLLDTLDDLALAANRVLAGRNLPGHPVAAYRTFVGDGLQTLIERILPEDRRDPVLVKEAMAAFEVEYARQWHVHSSPYPGIAALLDRLTAQGIRMSVLSNKPDAFTRLCVQHLLPDWHFHPLLGQRPGVPKKPDPAAAFDIARLLDLPPSSVLYVGDSGVDMCTARSAGMDAVGVLWGFRDADELCQAGARHIVAHPEELLPIIFSL
jgi:phosphoglycolate phosphatase